MKSKYRQKTARVKLHGKDPSEVAGEARRRIWLWIVAVLLAITFLAGELVNLLPLE